MLFPPPRRVVEFHLNNERYSSPSILPFAVAGYDDADQRVVLLWMLVLQATGDVAGRVATKDTNDYN